MPTHSNALASRYITSAMSIRFIIHARTALKAVGADIKAAFSPVKALSAGHENQP